MAEVRYREEGYTGNSYTIVEYDGYMSVFVYRGYIRGDSFVLYPLRSLRKGRDAKRELYQ
jgi:hypothetical protein